MPLGPSVLFTKSPTAIAPMKEDYKMMKKYELKNNNNKKDPLLSSCLTKRAFSALSSVA